MLEKPNKQVPLAGRGLDASKAEAEAEELEQELSF